MKFCPCFLRCPAAAYECFSFVFIYCSSEEWKKVRQLATVVASAAAFLTLHKCWRGASALEREQDTCFHLLFCSSTDSLFAFWCLCSKRHTAQQRKATIGWFYAHGKGAATAAASAGGKSRKSRCCCCVPKKAQNASRSKNSKCDVISLLTNEAKPILSFTFKSSHDLAVSKVWEILRKSSPFSRLFRMFNTTGIFHAYSSFFPMVLAQHRELRHKSKTKDLAQSPRLSRDTSNHIKRLVN